MSHSSHALPTLLEGNFGKALIYLAAIAFGFSLPYALAPYHWWWLSIVAPAGLALILWNCSGKAAYWRSFCFGAGMFGKGTSWVYISIYEFAGTPVPLAFIMTAIFVLGLALVFAFPFYFYGKYFSRTPISRILGFSALWVLGEWLRSWFLTGFPWLYVGYAHIDTWLSGWAPLFGVFTLSFFSILSAIVLLESARSLITHKRIFTIHIVGAIAVCIFWLAGAIFQSSLNKTDESKLITVGLLQPNVPLEKKWNPLFREDILDILREDSEALWRNDLVVWPEAAIPMMYHEAEYFLHELELITKQNDSALITGILYDHEDQETFYNAIVGLGNAEGMYFKQRLVPFGEYVPLEKWLRGLINFFDLPNSVIFPGPKNQEILSLNGEKIAPSICYEIVYPDLVSDLAKEASLLITISNDAWFGSSIGPIQHFQMAQMRALENNRFVIRGTNTGLSGIIDNRGKIITTSEQFERNSISQLGVKLIQTRTLFSYCGSYPIIILCFVVLALMRLQQIRDKQQKLVGLPD